MNLKQSLYNECLKSIDERLLTVKNTIADLQDSLQSETKSSAGDKHETGRAMLQLEREKAGKQFTEIEKLKAVLQKINRENVHQSVALGSIVYTTSANYYIAVSLGAQQLENQIFYAISPATPIAKLLISKQVGDVIKFRQALFTITNIQ